MKRDLTELADNVSGLVLPALSGLAKNARDIVAVFAGLDQSTVKTFFEIAAGAAIIGPVIFAIVRLIDVAFKLRAAFVLLSAGAGVAGFFGALAALPFTTIVLGIGAVTTAVAALVYAWQKLKGVKPPIADDISGPVGGHPAYKTAGAGAGKNGPTEVAPMVDAMKALEDRARNVTEAMKQMGAGWDVPGITNEWNATLLVVIQRLAGIKNALDPVAVKLRGIANDLTDAIGKTLTTGMPNVNNIPGVSGGVREGITMNPQVAALPGLSAANEAALRYADSQAYVTEKIAYEYQALRSNLEEFGIHLKNAGERAQGAILILADGIQNFAMQLASKLGGTGPNASGGRGIGGLLGSAAGFFLGGPAGAVVGNVLGTAAGGLIGGLFDHAKDSTDNAASAMDGLARQVEKVTASITNVPQWFKVQAVRFAAAPVQYAPPFVPTPGGRMGPSSGGGGGSMTINEVHVHVAQAADASDMEAFTTKLYAHALKQRGTGSRAPLIFARTGGL